MLTGLFTAAGWVGTSLEFGTVFTMVKKIVQRVSAKFYIFNQIPRAELL